MSIGNRPVLRFVVAVLVLDSPSPIAGPAAVMSHRKNQQFILLDCIGASMEISRARACGYPAGSPDPIPGTARSGLPPSEPRPGNAVPGHQLEVRDNRPRQVTR